MKSYPLCIVAIALATAGLSSQGKPMIVVQPFTVAPGVKLPYDMEVLQAQLVAEFDVMLGKQFDIVAERPASPPDTIYTLEAEIAAWRPGNAAKRLLVGLGTGREASELRYRIIDRSGQTVLERDDTIRTNFYSSGAGSTGTLAHPIAQKIADRIKDSRLK